MLREKRVARVRIRLTLLPTSRLWMQRIHWPASARYLSLLMGLWFALSVHAQADALHLSAEAITITKGDTVGRVILQGAAGSVPSRTDIFAQNLFTGEAVTGRANSAGAFSLAIGGTEFTPFALNAVVAATPEQKDAPATLPGDTGVIVWSHLPTSANGHTVFAAGGSLAYGAATWWGEGDTPSRLNTGDALSLTMDVVLSTANTTPNLALQVRGHLALERIADEDGQPVATSADLINGWTSRQTRAGLPILSAEAPIDIGYSADAPTTLSENTLKATLKFALPLPADLPAGLYVPIFRGDIRVGDSEWSDWYANRLLSTLGTVPVGRDPSGDSTMRLPVALQMGAMSTPHMLWTLFQAESSDGATGLVPVGAQHLALSNQQRYSPTTLVLPPGRYPIEPYLPSLFAPNFSSLGGPRVPLALPGGEYSVTITQPNAGVDRVAPQPFRQIAFEQAANQPLVARLTTLDPLLTDYPFTMYGIYDLTTSGTIQDVSGQKYTGGGAYRVLIAEPLDLTPMTPLGLPFQEGDAFHAGLRIAPALPAEVTATLRYFPLGQDKPILFTTAGQANNAGDYMPKEAFVFHGAGEYIVDYEARYTDAEGRLWANSIRGAGVVSSLDSALIAHGRRGLVGYDRQPLAWFDTTVYPDDAPALVPLPYWPYNSGDLVFLPNRAATGLLSTLTIQDMQGRYAATLPFAPTTQLDSLPTSDSALSYAYVSAVTPALTVRQLVQGESDAARPWSMSETFGGQIGGAALRTGDTLLLYGGIVTPDDTAGYAALGIVTRDKDTLEVVPPFTQPLFVEKESKRWIDVWSLSLTPGQQMTVGDTLSLAGQVLPPLPAQVAVTLTAPSGAVRTVEATANETGYFYNPDQNFVVNEAGVWQIVMETRFAGRTSAGVVERPYTGRRQFDVYVTSDATSITSDPLTSTLQTPGQAVQINLTVPQGWTDVSGFYTARTDGVLLGSGPLLVQTGAARYVYARLELARQSTTLETDGTGDVITLSFLLRGIDANGQPVARGRTYTVINGVIRANQE